MATNNLVNLKNSGIVSYDGAGTFTALSNPLTVSNGGTGDSSLTAYAVLCGGTTSTGAVQSIASVGTSGHALTSNGAGALPTFQAIGTGVGYGCNFFSGTPSFVTDSATYYVTLAGGAGLNTITVATSASVNYFVLKPGTLNRVYGGVRCTVGSNENCTVFIRVNNSSNTNVTTTLSLTATLNAFSNSSLGISLNAGDYFTLGFTGPVWATNPTNVSITATAVIE